MSFEALCIALLLTTLGALAATSWRALLQALIGAAIFLAIVYGLLGGFT